MYKPLDTPRNISNMSCQSDDLALRALGALEEVEVRVSAVG
jgi:hypothetical protein